MSFIDDSPRAFRDDDGHLLSPLPPEPEPLKLLKLSQYQQEAKAFAQKLFQQQQEAKIKKLMVEKAFAQQETLDETLTPDEGYATKTWIKSGTDMQCYSCAYKWSRVNSGTHKSRCPKCKSYFVGQTYPPLGLGEVIPSTHLYGCSCDGCWSGYDPEDVSPATDLVLEPTPGPSSGGGRVEIDLPSSS